MTKDIENDNSYQEAETGKQTDLTPIETNVTIAKDQHMQRWIEINQLKEIPSTPVILPLHLTPFMQPLHDMDWEPKRDPQDSSCV